MKEALNLSSDRLLDDDDVDSEYVCVCVSVALFIQHAACYNAICGLFGATVFPHCLIRCRIFGEKLIINYNMCFDFLYKFCL